MDMLFLSNNVNAHARYMIPISPRICPIHCLDGKATPVLCKIGRDGPLSQTLDVLAEFDISLANSRACVPAVCPLTIAVITTIQTSQYAITNSKWRLHVGIISAPC